MDGQSLIEQFTLYLLIVGAILYLLKVNIIVTFPGERISVLQKELIGIVAEESYYGKYGLLIVSSKEGRNRIATLDLKYLIQWLSFRVGPWKCESSNLLSMSKGKHKLDASFIRVIGEPPLVLSVIKISHYRVN